AEDGIRDYKVTGVQTCALPISLPTGRVTGLVGESGCGKTVTALAVMRLLRPPGEIRGGRVLLGGQNLLALSEREMDRVRGGRIRSEERRVGKSVVHGAERIRTR